MKFIKIYITNAISFWWLTVRWVWLISFGPKYNFCNWKIETISLFYAQLELFFLELANCKRTLRLPHKPYTVPFSIFSPSLLLLSLITPVRRLLKGVQIQRKEIGWREGGLEKKQNFSKATILIFPLLFRGSHKFIINFLLFFIRE